MTDGQFGRISAMVARYQALEGEWIEGQVRALMLRGFVAADAHQRARAAAAKVRAGRWPTQDGVMERLVGQRLAEPDVAGLQDPLLDEDEEDALALAGRRPGTVSIGYNVRVAMTLPVDLVKAGRRAAWRLSGGTSWELRGLRELRASRAAGMSYRQYRKQQAALLQHMSTVTWPDLVRQAVERFEA